MSAYNEMVAEIKDMLDAHENPEVLSDVAEHGADSGFPGFTYTSDCVTFYEAHEEAIWEILADTAENMGFNVPQLIGGFGRVNMADTPDGFKNLLTWFVLEEVCGVLVDIGEADTEDTQEEEG